MTDADDIIILGGQTLPVKGIAQANALSEFEIGIKTGNLGYDNRTQSFFHVMEDFSGGMGHRFFNQRDNKDNTFWDYPTDIPAADTRRPRHITLGQRQTSLTPSVVSVVQPDIPSVAPSFPYWGFQGTWQFAYGPNIYQTVDGVNFTEKFALGGTKQAGAIVLYSAYKAQFALYLATPGANYYRSDDEGQSWVLGNANHVFDDAIFWDEKVIAAEKNTIIFGIRSPNSPNALGLSSTSNTVTTVEHVDELDTYQSYQPVLGSTDQALVQKTRTTITRITSPTSSTAITEVETFVYQFVITGPETGPGSETSTQTPVQKSSSKETTSVVTTLTPTAVENDVLQDIWNVDDPNDKTPVGIVPKAPIHFVGIADAPWGEPAVYFTAAGVGGASLWVLDFASRKVYPIKIGLDLRITDARIWNGLILVSDGWNVYQYNAVKGEIQSMGLPHIDGLPTSLRDPELKLSDMIPADQYLYAIMRNSDVGASITQAEYRARMMCFNGQGWHQIGSTINSMMPIYGAVAAYENASPPTRRLHMFGSTGPTNMTVVNYDLPLHSNVPAYGVDHFQSSGGFITGWMDGGFADIEGVMLKLSVDALNLTSTETVTVYYQTDNDESMPWHPLYDADGVAASFTDTDSALYFQSASPVQGAQFRTVRFKVVLARGTNDTLTPELRALIFSYLKKPSFRSEWTFTIDISRMLESDLYEVDAVPATMTNVWAKLRDLWNTQTLLNLTIPSIELDDLNVVITNMPLSFDDFKEAVAGRGDLQLKVLEPVSRA